MGQTKKNITIRSQTRISQIFQIRSQVGKKIFVFFAIKMEEEKICNKPSRRRMRVALGQCGVHLGPPAAEGGEEEDIGLGDLGCGAPWFPIGAFDESGAGSG